MPISDRRTIYPTLLGMTCLAMLSAASAARALPITPANAATVEISIDNFTFSPGEITIAPGTTVTWINKDDVPHQVAERDIKFRSKALDTGDTFSRRFDAVSDVAYFCTLHPQMTGKIVVRSDTSAR